MTDYTAKRIILKNAGGEYLIPYTDGANTDLSNLTTTGSDKFVTKDTAQTISAIKTFSAVPVMTGALNAKDNSTNMPTTAWVRNHCCTTAATTSSTASKDAPAYVVTNYKSGDNWYRVWSDGWIEQGGRFQTASTSMQTVNLNKAFTTTNYKIQLTGYYSQVATNTPIVNTATGTKTKTAFSAFFATSLYTDWYACGY